MGKLWTDGQCIFAELRSKKILFMRLTPIGQLTKIFDSLGTSDEEERPGVNDIPLYIFFTRSPKMYFLKAFLEYSDSSRDLLQKML